MEEGSKVELMQEKGREACAILKWTKNEPRQVLGDRTVERVPLTKTVPFCGWMGKKLEDKDAKGKDKSLSIHFKQENVSVHPTNIC